MGIRTVYILCFVATGSTHRRERGSIRMVNEAEQKWKQKKKKGTKQKMTNNNNLRWIRLVMQQMKQEKEWKTIRKCLLIRGAQWHKLGKRNTTGNLIYLLNANRKLKGNTNFAFFSLRLRVFLLYFYPVLFVAMIWFWRYLFGSFTVAKQTKRKKGVERKDVVDKFQS